MSSEMNSYFPLAKGRAHEVCGAGASFFALALGAQVAGRVLWVREEWRSDQLNPAGFYEVFDPSDLLMAVAKGQTDVLAVAEETLRSGVFPVVILEVSKPLGLTEGRRLQLAARDGNAIALSLIPEGMGSNAAETRWLCTPVFDPADSTSQRWEIIKNKIGTLGVWHVRWDRAARYVSVVPPARQRPSSKGTNG